MCSGGNLLLINRRGSHSRLVSFSRIFHNISANLVCARLRNPRPIENDERTAARNPPRYISDKKTKKKKKKMPIYAPNYARSFFFVRSRREVANGIPNSVNERAIQPSADPQYAGFHARFEMLITGSRDHRTRLL